MLFQDARNRDKLPKAHERPQRGENEFVVEKSGRTFKFPRTEFNGLGHCASVCVTDEISYVAVYDSHPDSYRLLAFANLGGRVIWSSPVWASGEIVDFQGPGWHFVTIIAEGGAVTVFGASYAGVYIEVFDSKTGENRCRFGTYYFDAFQMRSEAKTSPSVPRTSDEARPIISA